MRPIVLIHGYSAEPEKKDPESIEGIYGTLPTALRGIYGDDTVVEIDLSRWISLDDGLTIEDVSWAFDRAIRTDEYSHLLKIGFDVIIHSTGALVIRSWLRKLSPSPSPLGHSLRSVTTSLSAF